jgi:two-component system sensor histidine kinase AtoS
VDLVELARAVAHSLSGENVTVDVEVWDENMPLVRGYHDALSRALTNIVINAVEASGETGLVVISVARRTIDGRPMVELRVRDTGAGIPPERLATIWQPYVTSKPGGTGLGLAIVRQTVLAHHGLVDASSTTGEGTEIVMALPIDGSGMETETEEE